MACLVGGVLIMAVWQVILVFTPSFFRERFQVSLGVASIIIPFIAVFYIVGNQIGGRAVNRFGRKPVTVVSAAFFGIITISFMNMSNFWVALALAYISCIISGVRATAVNSLTLEQSPSYRGTMMSLNSVASNIGVAIGAGLGGLAHLLFDYGGVGLSLGVLGIVAAIIYHLLVNDPANIEYR